MPHKIESSVQNHPPPCWLLWQPHAHMITSLISSGKWIPLLGLPIWPCLLPQSVYLADLPPLQKEDKLFFHNSAFHHESVVYMAGPGYWLFLLSFLPSTFSLCGWLLHWRCARLRGCGDELSMNPILEEWTLQLGSQTRKQIIKEPSVIEVTKPQEQRKTKSPSGWWWVWKDSPKEIKIFILSKS